MTEVKREMKEKEKSMNQTKLSVSNLDLYYGNFHALKNINLELPEKEITAFILALRLRQIHSAQESEPYE